MGETRTELNGDFPYLIGLLSDTDFKALARYRGRTGWECAAASHGQQWLRVPHQEEESFSLLPLLGRWKADASLKTYEEAHRIPERDLQSLSWKPLAKVLPLLPPVANAPAIPPFPIGFGLVRNNEFKEPSALLCSWSSFAAWCERTLAPRIECLSVVLSNEGSTLISGSPLPAIQGTGFYRTGELWIPTNCQLPDFVWPALAKEALSLKAGETALILDNGDFSVIPDRSWIKATRATVRVNTRVLQEEGSP